MLLDESKRMLTDCVLPFWKSLKDEQYGGYYGFMDFDLKLDEKAEKGCILNSRILWFFSKACVYLNDPEILGYAEHAYKFMVEHCIDKENGGVFWSVNYDGSVLDDIKHTYNQAFAVYALAAYYEASKDENALTLAEEIFDLIEEKCTDRHGYKEAFSRDFKPVSNDKLSENGVIADKTMNTILHVFEAYSGLYEVKKSEKVELAMRKLLDIFKLKVYNPKLGRQEVFFDSEMNSIIDLYSYGHDIESSWLIDWGTSLLGDDKLTAEIGEITSVLAENIYKLAYHKNSVWNECEKGVNDKTRVWWVQAEAIVGFINEYEKHPEKKEFLEAAESIWEYILTYIKDPRENSEWYWDVDDNGQPSSRKPIVEPWKCPYHNGRLSIELMRRNFNVTS